MEQLFEAFGIDGKLLLAQLINFGVLFVALTWLLYKPVMKTLDERRAKIAQGVEDAEAASQKLAVADENAAQVVQGAETEAEGIVASARELAGSEKSRIMKEAEARAAQVAADAEARAEETAAQALRDSEKEVARLAILAAEKVLRKS
ncbi:F0F1 ATP synthase subunit B [Patescibacteria group bacterium]|nr:F0F1 ATP synthase subunit B [Patescibacteria group bacterium]MBU1500892.1 F0F1 ATP synthase subunit B [Patescibacteria group bacterium]MBU2080947.1 F0F1 ATP synthase subunit B [Patescibacteria group bacterium]MBU2124052.1 F0F1 ATP synthase subunit B [Patescibacteria group bacterium]MBU2194657.1 F0F1 ATP synthase subunit B [Patescibacteria group bacterium]